MPTYTLGPLPWSEDTLRRGYSYSIINTFEAIKEHPGYAAHLDLESITLSLEIFTSSVYELFQAIENFRINEKSPEFWYRSFVSQFKGSELAVRRGVFLAAASAISLVYHSRVIKNRVGLLSYDSKRKEYFDENEHRFIQNLRNFITHVRMIATDWQVKISYPGPQTKLWFILKQDKLLQWKEWDKKAIAFINCFPKGIDVEELFQSYLNRVKKFQQWFQKEIKWVSEPELTEYRDYERLLNRFGSKSSWMILLEILINGNRDPFDYLDRELTKEELKRVLALPMRSKEQVDLIIEILDEYNACDEELKNQVYIAFGLNPTPKK